MENRNKLRGNKSKAPVIYTGIIMALLGIAFVLYATYTYLSYLSIHPDITEPGIRDIINSLSLLFTPQSFALPLTNDVIQKVLTMQITDLWWVYALSAAVVFIAATSNNKNDFRGMEHGEAKWADKYDLKRFADKDGIPCANNLYITVKNKDKKFYEPHNLNEVIIAGSGGGKTFREIKPCIMQMTGSYVVTDPKGELYRDTAKLLRDNGYKVRVLNLTNIALSNTYNPFVYMEEEQDVLNVADLFMKNSAGEGEKEDFWSGAAQDMLVMIMLYLFKSDSEIKSFGRVIRLVNSIQYAEGKIDPLCELARCMEHHRAIYGDDAVTVNWKSILGTPQETLGSIAKTLSTRLRLWAVEDVDMLTAEDEMDFDDIGVNKTAIFLIVPAARQTYKAVINIFYSQLFERLMYCANFKHNGKLPLLVNCLLDEFANIGRIPNFDETLAVVRSANIRICIVLQGLSQLKAIYEKTWESIMGNCSIFVFLGTNDLESNKYVSERLGKTTVRVDTRSYNRGNQGGGSDNENYVARDLLMPNEIPKALKRGKYGKCIVFIDEFNPFFLDKFDTLQHPLIGEVGSSFPKDAKNNSDITVDFAHVKDEKKRRYEEQQAKSRLLAEAIEASLHSAEEEKKSDEDLHEQFNALSQDLQSYNGDVIEPPDDDEEDDGVPLADW